MSVSPIKGVRIIKSVGSRLLPTVNILAVGNAGAPGEQPTVNQLLPALTPGGINPQQFKTVQASPSYQPGLKNLIVPSYYPEPDIDMNFLQGLYYGTALSGLTVSRASLGTDLLPTSPAGASYNTFANNIARITPGVGLLIEEARTNYLLNSTAPQTQTTASLGYDFGRHGYRNRLRRGDTRLAKRHRGYCGWYCYRHGSRVAQRIPA